MREIKWILVNPFTLLRDLLFNWWVILLCFVIGFSGCQVYYSAFFIKTYKSSMTMAVNLSGYTTNATATSLSRTIDIAETFNNVLNSSTLLEIVADELGEPVTGVFLAKHRESTNLIDVSVTDTDPEKAFRTLKAINENYPKLTGKAFNNIIINVISYPNMPSTNDNFRQILYSSILYGFLGMFLCILIILVISYFRDTVKNISDVEALLDTKLFGAIFHVNKRKSKVKLKKDGLLMTNPCINYKFSNSLREMAIKIESLKRTRKIQTIAVTSVAENEGKTTVSVNLAIALAELGHKVALVDCDFKLPAVNKFFGNVPLEEKSELSEFIRGKTDYESVIRYDPRTNLYLLGGSKQCRNSSELVSRGFYKKLIEKLKSDFEFVLIDTPPSSIAIDAEIIMEATDGTLLVVRQDFVPVEVINDFLAADEHGKLLGCVFNDICTVHETLGLNPDEEHNA